MICMFSNVVDGTHLFVKKSELSESIDVLRRRFTILPKFDDLESVQVFSETDDMFGFPRYYRDLSKYSNNVTNARSEGEPIDFEVLSPPRDRQVQLLERFSRLVSLGREGYLLVAPTGTGKTYMMLTFLSVLKRTALVIVPRDHIVTQWIDRIVEHTSLTRDDIGIVRQDKCEFDGKKIAVGLVHSLSKDKYSEEFKRWPGVVVFDEVHITGAKTFSKVVGMFPARYRIGASATPYRQDGMEEVYQLSIAQETLTLRGGSDVLPSVLIREYVSDYIPKSLSFITDRLSRRGVIISALASDTKRNSVLSMYTRKLYDSGRRVLLLSDRKDQLYSIRNILVGRFSVPKDDIGIFIQETKRESKKLILESSKIILATYGMMSMAVDVQDLSGLVFGTPQSHITQPLGRVLRKCYYKKDPVVVDIVDLSYREAVRWAAQRRKVYSEIGARMSLSNLARG